MRLLSATDRAALRVLRDALGPVAALRVGVSLRLRALRGEPFDALPPASDVRERASRQQAGGAVLLYRILRRRSDPERALQQTAAVVEASALAFLDEQVGALTPDTLAPLSPSSRRAYVADTLARFPNATATVDEASGDAVRFTITACRLVELVREVGHPELAPLFCAADARFFGELRPGLALDRPSTLAGGAPACAFHIHRVESA